MRQPTLTSQQGAAGMIPLPAGYLRRAADAARRAGALLILDEVAVGFGRSGSMFACEREGVAPDVLCLAKGLTALNPRTRLTWTVPVKPGETLVLTYRYRVVVRF